MCFRGTEVVPGQRFPYFSAGCECDYGMAGTEAVGDTVGFGTDSVSFFCEHHPVEAQTPQPRRLVVRVLKYLGIGMLALVLAVVVTARVALHAKPGVGKEPPAGYASTELLYLAYATGQLKTVDRDIPLPDSIEFREGVEYGKGGDVPLQLDLYLPKDLTGPTPVLMLVHGGGWSKGHRSDYRYYCIKFAERGYVVATVSYRLKKDALFPAAVEDTKCAVRWMRANAESFGGDPERIAMIGGSAGGHLAMMAGYSSDDKELEGTGGNAEMSSRVQAVVNLYGPVDVTTPYGRTHETVTSYLGKSYDEAPELYERCSPLHYVTDDDAPTLILHGTIDELVPISQAELLDEALEKVGVAHEYYPLEGWPHTMDVAQVVNDYCFERMLEFLEKHLGKK
ncbi:MAG: alpha/beta hydrolase [Planctomycetales bacterium]|nr:alpha/beta hydrolase [Planctomycetales bacterium]